MITRDLDFGDILRYPDHLGAIILRLPSEYTARELNDVLRGFLSSVDRGVLQRAIIILELGRYRKTPTNGIDKVACSFNHVACRP